jgi:transposase
MLANIMPLVPHDMMSDCQAAFIAKFFSPRLRYSGSPLGFHLASIVAG